MNDFEKAVVLVFHTNIKLKEKEERLLRLKEMLNESILAMITLCKGPCTYAINEYNQTADIKIVPETIKLSIEPHRRTLNIEVEMYTNHGTLHEELTTADMHGIILKLKPCIKKHLQDGDIPLTLGKFIYPISYNLPQPPNATTNKISH